VRGRRAWRAIGGLFLGACTLDLSSVPEPRPVVTPTRDAGEDSRQDTGTAPASLDAGSTAPDATMIDDAAQRAKHVACSKRVPEVLPTAPPVLADAAGRPLFDYFHELDCDDEAVQSYPTCASYDGSGPFLCDACVGSPELEARFCQSDAIPGPTCAPLLTGEGACLSCVPLEAKRRACCEGIDELCTRWPYKGTSMLGGPCAIHDDCEPGLVCLASQSDQPVGFGRCSCPDAYEPPPAHCREERLPL